MTTRELTRSTTQVLSLDQGDELVGELTRIARDRSIPSARLEAIGAFEEATLAYFDRETQSYLDIEVEEQVEVVSLNGSISWFEEEPRIHLHATLGWPDGTLRGGHLRRGIVWPTLECFCTIYEERLVRSMDEASGLPLWRLT